MDINLKGFKTNCGDSLMGDLIIYKGRRMTESETRKAVNYGIEQGYELASQIPDEVVDAICDTNSYDIKYDKYDDTPEFITLSTLKYVLREIQGWHDTIDITTDELIKEIEEKLDDL